MDTETLKREALFAIETIVCGRPVQLARTLTVLRALFDRAFLPPAVCDAAPEGQCRILVEMAEARTGLDDDVFSSVVRGHSAYYMRLMFDRAFPAMGGPPTPAEVERGLTLWAVSADGDMRVARARAANGLVTLLAHGGGWLAHSDLKFWPKLRCRPIDENFAPVPRGS